MAKIRKVVKGNIEHKGKQVDLEGGQARALYAVVMSRPSSQSRQKAEIGFLSKVATVAPETMLTVSQFEQDGENEPELTHQATCTIATALALVQAEGEEAIGDLQRKEVDVLMKPQSGRGGSGYSADALAEALGI